MANIELIVFDWDGTLSDSAERIVAAVHHAADVVGLPRRPAQEVRDIIGLGLAESVLTLYPDIDRDHLEPFAAAYRDAYLNTTDTAVLFPDVRATLDDLALRFTLAVATGKSRVGLDRELVETGVGHLFAATRCADETIPKPHPRMLQEIFDELGAAPQNTVMIGDTDHDLKMATSAGAIPVAVRCGAQREPRLRAAEPAVILDDVRQLPDWLHSR